MKQTETTTTDELLNELAFENPPPEEKWFSRDWFDPMHSMADLRAAAKMGVIELEVNEPKEAIRFRLTPKGRDYMKERKIEPWE